MRITEQMLEQTRPLRLCLWLVCDVRCEHHAALMTYLRIPLREAIAPERLSVIVTLSCMFWLVAHSVGHYVDLMCLRYLLLFTSRHAFFGFSILFAVFLKSQMMISFVRCFRRKSGEIICQN